MGGKRAQHGFGCGGSGPVVGASFWSAGAIETRLPFPQKPQRDMGVIVCVLLGWFVFQLYGSYYSPMTATIEELQSE
jgi:hypothetical protein